MSASPCRTERLCLGALLAVWLFALAYDAVLRCVQREYAGPLCSHGVPYSEHPAGRCFLDSVQ